MNSMRKLYYTIEVGYKLNIVQYFLHCHIQNGYATVSVWCVKPNGIYNFCLIYIWMQLLCFEFKMCSYKHICLYKDNLNKDNLKKINSKDNSNLIHKINFNRINNNKQTWTNKESSNPLSDRRKQQVCQSILWQESITRNILNLA